MARRKYRKTHPDNRGFKERAIVSELESFIGHDHIVVHNKQIEGGSSKRRPDMLINLSTHSIIIEIDERQHRSYTDGIRTADLIADVGHRLVVIRFNPDSYRSAGKKYRSLFMKTGKERVYRIGCPNRYIERISVLKNVLAYYIANAPDKDFVEHRLYFDKFDTASLSILQPASDISPYQ
jgi:hypothetical protein